MTWFFEYLPIVEEITLSLYILRGQTFGVRSLNPLSHHYHQRILAIQPQQFHLYPGDFVPGGLILNVFYLTLFLLWVS